MNTEERIARQLAENPVILYMKGTPDEPRCGFSAKAAKLLQSTGIAFTYVDILRAPFIAEKLPSVSNWPTYPQLFIGGEIVGGSDIIEELLTSGELLPMLQAVVA